MTDQPTTTTFSTLVPVIVERQVMSKEDAEKALVTLQKGHELSLKNLNAITEVTKENRDQVVEELATVKKFYDKIYSTRVPFTKMLDDLKEAIMAFERPADYKDKKSLYSQKRALIEAFDQQQLEIARKAQAAAEKVKQVAVYKTNLKANVQRALVEMIAAKKRTVIQAMGDWEAKLTLDNIEESEKRLIAQTPSLKREDYDKCFHLNFQMMTIVPAEEDTAMLEECIAQKLLDDEYAKRLQARNKQLHLDFFEEIKQEFTYEKYNTEYVEAIAPIINAVRARIPDIKKALSDKDAEAKRQAEIKQRTDEQQKEVAQEQEQRLDEVTHERDMGTMEAEFTQQAVTQDIAAPNATMIVQFENDKMWLKPFLEMVSHVAALPQFPGIVKKGEYIPAVKYFVTLYEKTGKEKLIKGVKWVEKAKTTIKQG